MKPPENRNYSAILSNGTPKRLLNQSEFILKPIAHFMTR